MSHCVAIQIVLIIEGQVRRDRSAPRVRGLRVIGGRQRWLVGLAAALVAIVCWGGLALADSLTSSPPAPLLEKGGPVEPINRQNFAWMNRLSPDQHQTGDPLMGNRWGE